MSVRRPELVRGLGAWAAVAVVIGTMIGTGIFIVPGAMARDAGSLGLVFLVWVVGGVLSLFGALTYAELGAALPEAGGEYAYLRRGFSEVWAYLDGWMHSIVGRPCSIATIAAGLLRFVSFLVPSVATPLFVWHIAVPLQAQPYEFVFTPAQIYAVGAIAIVTFVNYLGVRLAGLVQVVLTAIKIGAVLAVVVLGFALGGGMNPWQSLTSGSSAATVGGFFTALVAALWAYDGWNNVSLVGSEITNPQRNIPLALVGGVIVVGVLYILTNAVCFYVLPFDLVARSTTVASDVLDIVVGRRAAAWLTVGMILCALGTLNSSILSGARVPYAMARDGIFFRVTADIHPRFRTPAGALVFQGVLAAVLALSGTFEDLYSLFIFAQWIFYGLAAASVFGLRKREPDLERPYRTWGYPLVPAAFVAGSLALTLNLWLARPVRSSIGLVLILCGLFFYRHWRRERGAGVPEVPAQTP
jgi:basic amino acid/polyamine antiporter, APA family